VKILITGGAGFIGSNLTEHLLKLGHSVRVLDDFSTGFRHNLAGFDALGDFELMEGTILSGEDCRKAVQGCDAVSNQAAFGSVPRSVEFPLLYSMNNLHGTVNVFEAARHEGIKRVVYASSSAVYGDRNYSPKVETDYGRPLSPYAASKNADEQFAHAFANCYDMTMIGFRYFNVFGRRQNPTGAYAAVVPLFASKLLKGESPVIYGDGEQSRDFTYIDNVIQANLKGMTAEVVPGSYVLNIACGASTSVNQLFDYVASEVGTDVRPTYVPPRKGDIRDSMADTTAALELIGYRHEVGIEQGLKDTVKWYREQAQG